MGNPGAFTKRQRYTAVLLNGREVPFESLPAEKLRVLINAELSGK